MMKRTFFTVIGAFCFVAASVAAAHAVEVSVGRSELVSFSQDVSEIVIAEPNIADVTVHGARKISVIGKELGRTNLRVFNDEGRVVYDDVVYVVPDLVAIRESLNHFFPYENIEVKAVNDNVAISGVISSAEVADKAVKIVEEFLNDQRLDPAQSVRVINLAQIRAGQQVMLRVRIGEIQRSTLKRLGVTLGASDARGNFLLNFDSGSPIADAFGSVGVGFNTGNANLSATLDALEQDGLFRVLAEPNLVAISGERAEFLAGGEFPIPVAQGDGAISVQFREYGVGVQFTPYVLSHNKMRLVVQPEVSDLSDAGAVTVDGINVPALTTRRVKTTVELAPGEGFMIAGLINDTVNTTVNEIPGIAEVPILSSLFRNTSTERTETELVIAVIPYIVDPVSGTEIRLPSDDFRPASLMESFFYGALGAQSQGASSIGQTPTLEGPVGFLVD